MFKQCLETKHNVLITGGSGYVGSATCELLLDLGHNVIISDYIKPDIQNIPFYQGDFAESAPYIFQENNVTCVIHLAAYTQVDDSMINPDKYFDNNVIKSIRLLNIMREYGCANIIFSSSASVYGDPVYVPIDEKHPTKPTSPYGESKLMFESALRWYHDIYGIKYNIFRYFNVIGTSALRIDRDAKGRLLPLIIQVASGEREYLDIYGIDYSTPDGTCIRDYIHVLDIAKAHTLSIDNLQMYPKSTYNLGYGAGISVLEMVKTVEEVAHAKISIKYKPRRAGDIAISIASAELASQELGWIPEHRSLKETIEQVWWQIKGI